MVKFISHKKKSGKPESNDTAKAAAGTPHQSSKKWTPSAKTSEAEGEAPKPRPKRRRRRSRKPAEAQAKPQAETTDQPQPKAKEKPPRAPRKAPPKAPAKPWKLEAFEVPKAEGETRFHDVDLPLEIMHAVADLGFSYCTPIQAGLLPSALKGSDVTGRAQTGTGKTAAFLITILAKILRNPLDEKRRLNTPRALVIAPTRELAMQIEREASMLGQYSNAHIVALYGGARYETQKRKLAERPVDLVVATPGRLLDFKSRHDIHLNHVEIMVIDEADHMLDMGFIPDVRRIIHGTPPRAQRQTMLFSATLTPDVIRLASQWMKEPVTVEIEPTSVAVDTVNQIVYIVTNEHKFALLYNIIKNEDPERAIVFANRRDTADHLCENLAAQDINCALLSGALPQSKREKTLEAFRGHKIKILVATDVAGRGLHVDGVSHVINYNLPHDAEDYVHRIGRTGRAGNAGTSISFACEADSFYIPEIEEYMGKPLPCAQPEEEWLKGPTQTRMRRAPRAQGRRSSGPNRRRSSGPRRPRR